MAENEPNIEQYANWTAGKNLRPEVFTDLPMDVDPDELLTMRDEMTQVHIERRQRGEVRVTAAPPTTERQMTESRRAWQDRLGEPQWAPSQVTVFVGPTQQA